MLSFWPPFRKRKCLTVDLLVNNLPEAVLVVVWFLCVCSVASPALPTQLVVRPGPNSKHKQAVHGLSIPLGKLGYYLPRTISRNTNDNTDAATPSSIRSLLDNISLRLPTFSKSHRTSLSGDRRASSEPGSRGASCVKPTRSVWRIGGTVIPTEALPGRQDQQIQSPPERPGPTLVSDDQPSGEGGAIRPHVPEQQADSVTDMPPPPASRPVPGPVSRTIRFPDET